jgi:hypothetical protein
MPRVKTIHMPPMDPRELNEHEQIILQEHGVLYFDEDNLVITSNKVWMKAMQYVNPKHKRNHIYRQVPTAAN